MFVYIYTLLIVLCCIGNGNSYNFCEYLVWSKQIFSNITSISTCFEEQSLYKTVVLERSWLSIIGLGNFYSKHYFDGVFELVEGAIATFLVLMCPGWLCKIKESIKTFISVVVLSLLIFCHAVELTHMYCSRSFKIHTVTLLTSLLLAALLYHKTGLKLKTFVMITSVLIIILNTVSNLFLFEFNLKLDGYGCPFKLEDSVMNISDVASYNLSRYHAVN